VIAGSRIFALAEEKKRRIIPVDSEHSAIFKLIHAHGSENIDEIILTASGGAFRNYTHQMLKDVTPEQAMRHPTWSMGRKITVDSATLANKGLEVIEAARFFGFPPERINVVIHPQSIVHSMVRLKNGAVYAQMSSPDMRLPILDALCWPETSLKPLGSLDFDSLTLTFEKCDMQKFPMLELAYRALAEGELMPAVYNAANEAAVEAFLNKRIGFLEISSVVRYVIDSIQPTGEMSIDNALEWDKASREAAESFIKQTGNSLNGSASC
jgi:1-deoxy-D-xylulose-5-phosphate reductoisomerase